MTFTLPTMITNRPLPGNQRLDDVGAQGFAWLMPPFPLFALQPLLGYIVTTIAKHHPELIARLGDNCKKRFLIDPRNLPEQRIHLSVQAGASSWTSIAAGPAVLDLTEEMCLPLNQPDANYRSGHQLYGCHL